ncbi:hypothetical protein CP533_2431 [Ophiocordyceps camponoti-saundersi (nom. inval.)]|nr:hypothetical protein CP533_2431 [Ophiocordyceps camponoti-saundersi (nom. inval.)]
MGGMKITAGEHLHIALDACFDTESTARQCAILANSTQLDRVQKVIIPRALFQSGSGDPTDVIRNFVRQNYPHVDPERALYISYIEEGPDLQMLIPFGLLNANGGGLNISVECAESENKQELQKKVDTILGQSSSTCVNYISWDNVNGELSDVESNAGSDGKFREPVEYKTSRLMLSFRLEDEPQSGSDDEKEKYKIFRPGPCLSGRFGGNATQAFDSSFESLRSHNQVLRQVCGATLEDQVWQALESFRGMDIGRLRWQFPHLPVYLLPLLEHGLCRSHIRKPREAAPESGPGSARLLKRNCCTIHNAVTVKVKANMENKSWESEFRPLGVVIDVKLTDVDRQTVGDVYGSIVATDLLGTIDIYRRGRDLSQKKGPGNYLGLEPPRPIEAKSLFSITADLWDSKTFVSDRLISHGWIAWVPTKPDYDEIKEVRMKGDYGSATMRYVVLHSARIATIKVRLDRLYGAQNNHYTKRLYGDMSLETKYEPRRTFFHWEFQDGKDFVLTAIGHVIPTWNSVAAVAMDDSLKVHVDLYNLIPVYAPGLIKGTVEFSHLGPNVQQQKVYGQDGEVTVQVEWS